MNKNDIIIRVETPADFAAAENLTREAFWNVYRPGCTEHYVLHRYRSEPDYIPELSLVLEVGGELVGHVMYAWSRIDTPQGAHRMMTFGPISIAPAWKRQGYGKLLLDESMHRAALLGGGVLAITGNIDFYGKSGFTLASAHVVRYADAAPEDADVPYFLIRELTPGFLNGVTGVYRDPEPYFIAERDPDGFAAYEAQFPYKEKLRLPGQLV